VLAYQVELGGSYCNLGNIIRDSGKPAESLEWFAKAIGALAPIHEREPRDLNTRRFLRNGYGGRAKAQDRLRHFAEAIRDWDKAIELSPKEEQPWLRALRATSRVNAGQVAEAVAEVAELTSSSSWNANQWYDFACVYAVASSKIAGKKAEYSDRAMALLQQAVKAGWKEAAYMKKDPDMDPLREREDFKKLLAELEQNFPPPKEAAPPPREKK
jgi:tetratricopeptide (TPR) repeat protein